MKRSKVLSSCCASLLFIAALSGCVKFGSRQGLANQAGGPPAVAPAPPQATNLNNAFSYQTTLDSNGNPVVVVSPRHN